MTPAITALRRARIEHRVHEYRHDPGAPAYGLEAAQALGVDPARVFKTLVVATEPPGLVVAIVPAAQQVDLKALAAAVGAKRTAMADPAAAERATGYVIGGISPLGQKRRLPTIVHATALDQDEMYVSAGRRGLQVSLAPRALIELLGARTAAIAR